MAEVSALSFAALEKGLTLSTHELKFKAEPVGTDVLVKVSHCGICHSDIHKINDEWSEIGGGHTNFPLVPGHEVIGEVIAVGPEVKDVKVGDRVGLGPQRDSCGGCGVCVTGDEEYCGTSEFLYDPKTGGYASHINVKERFVFKIPDEISSAEAAPLLCAGVTTYSPFAHFKLPANAKVAILGIGGLGHLALQWAAALGYDVTAISTSANKKEMAEKFGAKHFVVSTDPEQFKAALGTFDFILSTVSANQDVSALLAMLRPGGNLCYVGLPTNNLTISPFQIVAGRKSVSGSMIGGTRVMKEMLEVAAKNGVRPMIEVVPVKFSDAGKATEIMHNVVANKARFRYVFQYEN